MTQSAELVSIVIPVYNSEKFLSDTIATIQAQTYTNWEAIFVDDKSTDDGAGVIEAAAKQDERIKLSRNKINSGAGVSRNNGVALARGRYLCFLDADDLWHPEKLERQLAFISETNAEFTCTGYEFADKNGRPNGKQVEPPAKANYRQLLKNVTTWTSTVMFDMTKLSTDDIEMPNIPRGEDATTWRRVLKKVDYVHGLSDILAYYRRTNDTLSSDKIAGIKSTFSLYREQEGFSVLKSVYYTTLHYVNATKRRI